MNKVYELTKESWHKLVKDIKDITANEKAENYIIELKHKARSYEQLKLYWSKWLPAILYFLNNDIKLYTCEELHIYLKEFFCYTTDKNKYYKELSIMNAKRYVCLFSIDFARCSQEVFNKYMNFVSENFYKIVSVDANDIEELIKLYENSVVIKDNE